MDRPTHVARVYTDPATASRLADGFAENFDLSDTAIATFASPSGEWAFEVHFRDPPDESAIRAMVHAIAGERAARDLTFDAVAARDWVATSLAGLAPVTAGRFLVHGAHDRGRAPPTAIAIEIEAALAFGTGHHGTTRGCLLALDRILRLRRPRAILDVGTGTGVLVIAAARAFRRRVLATDIDPVSVQTARENARLNHVPGYVVAVRSSGLRLRRIADNGPFDLVFANILLEPLK